MIDFDAAMWVLARVAGLSSFAALSISLLTGLAIRSGVLQWLSHNRGLRSVHEFTAWLWIPLGALHLTGLLLDRTARVSVYDLVIPFQVPYGTVAFGLGTISLELITLVAITGWLRRRMNSMLWEWIHRTSYLAFALLFLHAVLGGSDFSEPTISALTWAVAFGLAALTMARFLWGRLPA